MSGERSIERIGVIPAAGLGTRAYPYTATIPKGLLEVDGKSVLERNLELLRDQVGVRRVLMVIGYRGEAIRERFGNGSELGLELEYVVNDQLELGLAHSLRLAGRRIGTGAHAVVLLSDEVYVGTRHQQLAQFDPGDAIAACGVLRTDLPRQIRRNYSVVLDGERITKIVEKPRQLVNDLLGTGTYYLTPAVFERLEETFANSAKAPDWMEFLGGQIEAGASVRAVQLGGQYANVNDKDELHRANFLVRSDAFAQKRVSVVIAVDRAGPATENVARRFCRALGVDELIVARRSTNSTPNPDSSEGAGLDSPSHSSSPSSPRSRSTSTPLTPRTVEAPADASFGDLLRVGLDAATGDLLVLVQDDDTFSPDDLPKLLTYARDCDLVVGTRTTRQLIEQGSNMRGAVRVAHLVLAKFMELLWWDRAPRFTDAGCVYRALWRSTWTLVRDQVRAHGQEICPEMIVEVLRARRRVIEIPVNYFNRDPRHAAVRSRHQTLTTFWRILALLVRRRFQRSG